MRKPDESKEEYVERMDKEHKEKWICLGGSGTGSF